MTLALQQIIAKVRHTNDVEIGWHSVGGRACPIGWWDCSQPVYESNCGQFTDHGERGGPGDTFCRTECPHGHQPPDEPELGFGEPNPASDAGVQERRPLGGALAMRVLQSDLYRGLDDAERADCDELVRRNLDWCKADASGGKECRAKKTTTGWYCDCIHPEQHCKPFAASGVKTVDGGQQ